MRPATRSAPSPRWTSRRVGSPSCARPHRTVTRRPSWSPDGQQIVFFRSGKRTAVARSRRGCRDLASSMPTARTCARSARRRSPPQEPDWSPDGARSSSFHRRSTRHGAWTRDIYTIRPDGTDVRRLTDGRGLGRPDWTPDGRILFVRGRRGGAAGLVDDGRRRHRCRPPRVGRGDRRRSRRHRRDPPGLAADRRVGDRAAAVDAATGDRRRAAGADARRRPRPRTWRPASAGPAPRPPTTEARSARRPRCSPMGACSSPGLQHGRGALRPVDRHVHADRLDDGGRAAARPRRGSWTAASCSRVATTAAPAAGRDLGVGRAVRPGDRHLQPDRLDGTRRARATPRRCWRTVAS